MFSREEKKLRNPSVRISFLEVDEKKFNDRNMIDPQDGVELIESINNCNHEVMQADSSHDVIGYDHHSTVTSGAGIQ
jgi:hypothetical protein